MLRIYTVYVNKKLGNDLPSIIDLIVDLLWYTLLSQRNMYENNNYFRDYDRFLSTIC